MATAYEQARQRQMAKNLALLHSLELPSVIQAVKDVAPVKATPAPRKRKNVDENGNPVPKAKKVWISSSPASSSAAGEGRRSSRIQAAIARKELEDQYISDPELGKGLDSDDDDGGERAEGKQRRAQSLKTRTNNPKKFGSQPGIPVGKTWEFRMGCSQDGIHAPVVAGISGNVEVGVWSIALSGGYEDDIDLGYAFTYTGSGGRDLKGTKANPKNLRTAPQSSDQEFTAMNAALQYSVTTKKPIRVIRGFKGKSCFAPETGYRYDGLYLCTAAWQDIGESGFKVCRYSFVRLPGQPAIPIREGMEEEAAQIVADFGQADYVPSDYVSAKDSVAKADSISSSPSSEMDSETRTVVSSPSTSVTDTSGAEQFSSPIKGTA
ncbi:hypothetical protein T439DRAFT_376209 [Meredithblackwellia eburnea MCA 4105]